MDHGCGTLGDMGVHIFDTPYNALALDVPFTIKNKCRKPTGLRLSREQYCHLQISGKRNTQPKNLNGFWYDGPGAPKNHKDLRLP